MRLALVIGAFVSLSGPALAQEPAPPLPGTSLTGVTEVVNGGRGRDPGRTWRTEPYRYRAEDRPWEALAGITLIDEERSTSIGIDAGPFERGRWVLGRNEHGEVAVEVGRVWTRGHVGAGIEGKNVAGRAHFDLAAQGASIFLGAATHGAGDPRKMTWVNAGGFATAFAGGEANGDVYGRIGTKGAGVKARAGAFIGAKAVAVGLGGVTVCGVSVHTRGGVSAQYGVGGELAGTFHLDWATMTVAIGADASATLGLGAGLGGGIEISLENVLRDPRGAARCAGDLAEVFARNLKRFVFCPWCAPAVAKTGFNGERENATREAPSSRSAPPSPGGAAGAGVSR